MLIGIEFHHNHAIHEPARSSLLMFDCEALNLLALIDRLAATHFGPQALYSALMACRLMPRTDGQAPLFELVGDLSAAKVILALRLKDRHAQLELVKGSLDMLPARPTRWFSKVDDLKLKDELSPVLVEFEDGSFEQCLWPSFLAEYNNQYFHRKAVAFVGVPKAEILEQRITENPYAFAEGQSLAQIQKAAGIERAVKQRKRQKSESAKKYVVIVGLAAALAIWQAYGILGGDSLFLLLLLFLGIPWFALTVSGSKSRMKRLLRRYQDEED